MFPDQKGRVFPCSLASEELASSTGLQTSDTTTGLTKKVYEIKFTDIKTVLDKLQIEYLQFEYKESTNITKLLTEADSEQGSLLLDFLSITNDFKKLPEDVRSRVIKFYKDHSRIERSDDGDMVHFFDRTCDIFVIKKS